MPRNQHIYVLTRDVTVTIHWQNAYGQPCGEPSQIEKKAGRYIFRGGVRAFRAHLAAMNAEYGYGYAVAEGDA